METTQMVVVLEQEPAMTSSSSSSSPQQTTPPKQSTRSKMIDLTPKQAQRYHEMFKRLDTNSDGKIDVSDLLELFERLTSKSGNDQSDSVDRAKVR